MRLLVLILAIFFQSVLTDAQDLSGKHVSKINNQVRGAKKLKLYRRFYHRDSAKWARKMDRHWKKQTDSIDNTFLAREKALEKKKKQISDGISSKVFHTVYKPWAKKQSIEQIRKLESHGYRLSPNLKLVLANYFEQYFLEASQNDEALAELKQQMPDLPLPKQLSSKLNTYKVLNPGKVLALKQSAWNKVSGPAGFKRLNDIKNKTGQYKVKLKGYDQYAQSFSSPDSLKDFVQTNGEKLATGYVSRLDGFSALSKESEFSKLKTLPGQYKNQVGQLQDSTYLRAQAKQKAEEMAMNYVSEHPEIMNGVQRKMVLLMKKFSSVPNSNDLSTAIKRTSLKGRSFRQRLYFAGNFQILNLVPFSIDLSPMIGYRFNTKFLVGIGGNYRQTFNHRIPKLSPTVFGYKVFSSYDVIKNFFGYTEFDRNSPGARRTETRTQLIWKNAAFVGIGRRFLIRPRIEMTTVMMYNLLYDHADPVYPERWNVKIGLQTSELGLFKR